MTDLTPLAILLPGVSEDVLHVVEELLLKGSSVMNKDVKIMVQQVFKMISIGATFTCCALEANSVAFVGDVKNETGDGLEFDEEDLKVMFDITVKLEQLESSEENMNKENESEVLNLANNCAETSCKKTFVDKFGRRRLLILSEMFISIAFCMLGTFFYIQESHSPCPAPDICQDQFVTAETVDNLAWLPLASIVTFAVAYSMGMGPLPWVLNAELFATEAKAPCSSLCASVNWVCSFLVVKFSPSLEGVIGASGSYLTFAALAACGTLLIVVTVPETKGKTEEEVQQGFKDTSEDLESADLKRDTNSSK